MCSRTHWAAALETLDRARETNTAATGSRCPGAGQAARVISPHSISQRKLHGVDHCGLHVVHARDQGHRGDQNPGAPAPAQRLTNESPASRTWSSDTGPPSPSQSGRNESLLTLTGRLVPVGCLHGRRLHARLLHRLPHRHLEQSAKPNRQRQIGVRVIFLVSHTEHIGSASGQTECGSRQFQVVRP